MFLLGFRAQQKPLLLVLRAQQKPVVLVLWAQQTAYFKQNFMILAIFLRYTWNTYKFYVLCTIHTTFDHISEKKNLYGVTVPLSTVIIILLITVLTNPAYGRHWISQCVRIVEQILKYIYIYMFFFQVSHVTYRVLRITCHLSYITNANSHSHWPSPANSLSIHIRMELLDWIGLGPIQWKRCKKLRYTDRNLIKDNLNYLNEIFLTSFKITFNTFQL